MPPKGTAKTGESRKSDLVPVSALWLFGIFFAAGFLNGFSGAGGGMVTGVFLPRLFRDKDHNTAFAYTALAVFLFSLVSAVIYLLLGRITLAGAWQPLFPALLGGAIGAYLLQRIDPILLKCLFAGLLIYSGVRFVWG